MQVLMWIAVGMAVVLGFIVLMPVLVVGTWFVVMTVILGLADGILWVLDQVVEEEQGWRKGWNPSPACRGQASRNMLRWSLRRPCARMSW